MRISDWSSDVCSSDLVALRRGADADRRAGDLAGDLDRDRFEHAFDDDRKGAGLRDRDGVVDDRARFLFALAAHAIAAEAIDRLRGQSDMPHTRDAGLGQKFPLLPENPPVLLLPPRRPGVLAYGNT